MVSRPTQFSTLPTRIHPGGTGRSVVMGRANAPAPAWGPYSPIMPMLFPRSLEGVMMDSKARHVLLWYVGSSDLRMVTLGGSLWTLAHLPGCK